MTRVPMIGVLSSTARKEGDPAVLVKDRYISIIAQELSAVPVVLPLRLEASAYRSALHRLDAVLLTGDSSNISPRRYGKCSAVEHPPVDRDRDRDAAIVIGEAHTLRVPVLGICRGLQDIAVAHGCRLTDLRDQRDVASVHHADEGVAGEQLFQHWHTVTTHPGGLLDAARAPTTGRVNSVHYQVIEDLESTTLRVEALSEDGLIEAVSSVPGAPPVLAVQWHPEDRSSPSVLDCAFWRASRALIRQNQTYYATYDTAAKS